MMGAATEKARLHRFSLVLGIESCCEVDDLSYVHSRSNTADIDLDKLSSNLLRKQEKYSIDFINPVDKLINNKNGYLPASAVIGRSNLVDRSQRCDLL